MLTAIFLLKSSKMSTIKTLIEPSRYKSRFNSNILEGRVFNSLTLIISFTDLWSNNSYP